MATGCALVGTTRRTAMPRATDGAGLAVAPLADGREERDSSRCVRATAAAARCGRVGLAHGAQLLKGGLAIRALVLIDRHRLVPRLSDRSQESPKLSGKESPSAAEAPSVLSSSLEAPAYSGWLRLVWQAIHTRAPVRYGKLSGRFFLMDGRSVTPYGKQAVRFWLRNGSIVQWFWLPVKRKPSLGYGCCKVPICSRPARLSCDQHG
jgi:hypothetical protein